MAMAGVRFLVLAAIASARFSSGSTRPDAVPWVANLAPCARTHRTHRRSRPTAATSAFALTMMGSRRGKSGNLKRSLDDAAGRGRGASGVKSVNSGRGQEVTGVTLPEKGKIRGWAFGDDRTICAANVDGRFFAIDGACPRCAFDLFRGKLLTDEDIWGPEPCVACPTCGVTYSLKTGKAGAEYKRKGLAGFVNTWAKTATAGSAAKHATAFVISRDKDTGQVFCRER